MRKVIILLMVMAIAGTTWAQDLGNFKELPVKDAPNVTYIPPDEVRVGGDTVVDATIIPGFPFSDTGNTCNFLDDYDEICPFSGSTSPDVVYSFTAASDIALTVDLCGSMYDTKTYIWDSDLNLVACNDDFYFDEPCGAYVSKIESALLEGGETYFIVIDGFGGDCGDYVLYIDSSEPCFVICDSDDALPEGEPPLGDGYLDDWNGGCNSPEFGNPFQLIDYGTADGLATMCGLSGWFDNGERDTDWFIAQFGETGTIEVTLESEYPCYLFELGPQDCQSVVVLQTVPAGYCYPVNMTVSGDPGSYTWLWVGPDSFVPPSGFVGFEFPYILTLSGHDVLVVSTEELSWGGVKALYH